MNRLALIAATGVLALMLSACGDESKKEETTTTTTTTQQPAPDTNAGDKAAGTDTQQQSTEGQGQ